MAWRGKVRRGRAGHGGARHGMARPGPAWHGKARQEMTNKNEGIGLVEAHTGDPYARDITYNGFV